ncbi:hypothetical protein [Paenibacillus tarimensis]|uniref:hypothetical protein n=1 Tax=Paenibacillus tarimensis TaxID=416012 RepID=UPI001F23C133|nr:hypothetical protein [Paenibacillus tarimensis]MCF2945730.1 hypothetical protein [Paenibacillus tarimensis]
MKKVVYSVVVATAVLASPVVGQALPAAASSTASVTSYSVTESGASQTSFTWINSQAASSPAKSELQLNDYDRGQASFAGPAYKAMA